MDFRAGEFQPPFYCFYKNHWDFRHSVVGWNSWRCAAEAEAGLVRCGHDERGFIGVTGFVGGYY